MTRKPFRPWAMALLTTALGVAQEPPTIVQRTPADGDVEVDAAGVAELIVVFDRPMSTGGFSFCGGGPAFPPVTDGKRPYWKDSKTCVLPVTLEPGRSYRLSLNCPAATNFRSGKGVALRPAPWQFATLPAELRPPAEQEQRNARALDEVQAVLESAYSYYDRLDVAWGDRFGEHRAAIHGARTDQGWVRAVAALLAEAQDLHLTLSVGGAQVGTASRAVDPLVRPSGLQRYLVRLREPARGLAVGRTEDDIAYLMIGSWSRSLNQQLLFELLAQIAESGSRALVLDVRANSGGDEGIARQVAAWFVEGARVYAKNRYRIAKGPDGFGPVRERSISGNTDARRLRIPVALLVSRYVMSSNEAFVLMMKQVEGCTVIGQRTFGSSGNPKPHRLSNDVVLNVPSWQALLPDGTCFEGVGIAPDVSVEVDPAELEKRDPILERALSHLRKS